MKMSFADGICVKDNIHLLHFAGRLGMIRDKLLLFQGEQKCQIAVGKIVKDRNNYDNHDHD